MVHEWQALAIDEGQRLKNSSSKTFKMTQTLRVSFKMLLSGTPLQNNFDELFNLMEWLDPGKFCAKWRREIESQRTTTMDVRE